MRKFNQNINQKIVNFWRRSLQSQWLLLLVWIAIATYLRLTNLTDKPPWADEFSTLVFSLGNSFQDVPLDIAIAPETLLQPLQPYPNSEIKNVVDNLLTHSNHPPVYFILTHWWMQLFPTEGGLVSLWGARSLSVMFGVVSIPAIYGLGRLAFHSRLVGQFAAAIMAVSPYGIYLAQEARHYTLAILLVIASFSCFMISIRQLQQGQILPILTAFIWVIVNSLGIAIHYFFVLTICAEAIVLIFLVWLQNTEQKTIILPIQNNLRNKFSTPQLLLKFLASFSIVILGTLAGGLVWLPFWKNGYSSQLTAWVSISDSTLKNLFSPIFQFLATGITMLFLLPIESANFLIAIISAVAMILFLIWIFPILISNLITNQENVDFYLSTVTFGAVILATAILFFSFTYILRIDLTRGARYSFVYFPAVIVFVAAILARIFNQELVKSKFFNFSICTTTGKNTVILVGLMILCSGLTVVSNLGYQKYYRPDLLVSLIEKKSDKPIVIATLHQTHVETGEMMGIAWNMKHNFKQKLPSECRENGICQEKSLEQTKINLERVKFILVEQKSNREKTENSLQEIINKLEDSFDLWLVNFSSDINIALENCQVEQEYLPLIDGYKYQLYHCSSG